jgi:hypothetical protein
MSWQNVLVLLGVLTFFVGCKSDRRDDLPDVSKIPPVKLQIRRFEQDLFKLDTNNFAAALSSLKAKYGEFAQIYFEHILGANSPENAPQGELVYLKGFLRHPMVRKLYDTVQVVYPELPEASLQPLQEALRYYQYYFPKRKIPTLTTFVSEYSIGNFVYGKDELAIGLDFFLGEKYPYLSYNPDNPNFSQYLTRTFNAEHIAVKTLQPLVSDIVGEAPPGETLLDYMIHNGKKMYLLDHLLPYAADTAKMEVSALQWKWLTENEQNIWAFFLQQNLLYNSEWQKIRKFVEYSPNSPGMPTEAPGRTGDWLGWQIIKAYVAQNPNTSMQDVLRLNNSQDILKRARYKPKL